LADVIYTEIFSVQKGVPSP